MMIILTKMTPLAANMENLIPLPTPPSTIFRPFGDEDAAAADEEVGGQAELPGLVRIHWIFFWIYYSYFGGKNRQTEKSNH